MSTTFPAAARRRPLLALAWGLTAFALVAATPAAAQRGRAEVEGTVTHADGGEPVTAARVILTAVADPAISEGATTGADGVYAITLTKGLPGTFTLRVEAEGFEPLTGPVEILEGQQGTVDVELVAAGTTARQKAIEAYNAGVVAFEAGDYEAARSSLGEALASDPDLAAALLGLAQVELRLDHPAEAASRIEQYLAQRPDDEKAHRLAFEAYRALSDADGMARAKAALAGSGSAAALARDVFNEGAAAFKEGDLATAKARFEEALALDPTLAEAATGIAAVLYQQKEYADAAAAAAALLEREPDDANARRLRFLALEAAEDPAADAALTAYAEADPETVIELLSGWAEEDFKADRNESAEKQLLRLLAIRPDAPETHYRLGLVYASMKQNAKAKEHLRRFLELAPDHPEAGAARDIIAAL